MSRSKSINPTGHLKIYKRYMDGTEELHFDQQNVITSGLGVGLSHLFSASGSNSITDFQIINFLVGSGGDYNDYGASTYKLQAPVKAEADWGDDTSLIIETVWPWENGVAGPSRRYSARIPFSNINKVTSTSVRYTLVLDRNTLNGASLNEVGLYMRNPRGTLYFSFINSILVAYRPFTEITKTSDFSLIFRWTLQF
jgi:hypothetical protein